ncbi:glycosyltransferase involved in cell wall biosynthesis [Desulfobotulus alkaliphilus]|uniref:tRNA-queuosine alpha-mannosyltransferase n=1 Tax=Desulfobotulus alkaliphilus TaxID=622671 RepID=A0A562RT78_9BACT|nr:DUF3524 domain-containing protein [Desulfobotulus alkaliphilus]TWI72242.1 glycosyltransferase involved in cell wall biosynthesis [Desulfobotulus alkaliphilus]
MRFLMLEAYYGGSHKAFMDGLCQHLPHTTELKTLPARHWKWRMRSAALLFLKDIEEIEAYDAVITTNMTGVADFKALAGPLCPPVFLYFHENQFDYPPSPHSGHDLNPALTDLTSALAADCVAFNSEAHRIRFLKTASEVLSRFPKPDLLWTLEAVEKKSVVLYPGCDFALFLNGKKDFSIKPRCIVWNHRWEHDKNPSDFFDALSEIQRKRIPFHLMLLGARHAKIPEVFNKAMAVFKDHLVYSDYPSKKEDYARLLSKAHICVSTADQENFGMAVAEAMAAGCLPLLPARLSYPELLPEELHPFLLYKNREGLVSRLEWLLSCPEKELEKLKGLSSWILRFDWKESLVPLMQALEGMVLARPSSCSEMIRK